MKLDSLKTLYIHELNDLHDADSQILQARVAARFGPLGASGRSMVGYAHYAERIVR